MLTKKTKILFSWFSMLMLSAIFMPAASRAAGPCDPVPPQDQDFWEAVKDSGDPVLLNKYLIQFPDGCYVRQAKARIRIYVDDVPPLQVTVVLTNGTTIVAREGELVTGNVVELMQFDLLSNLDPKVLRVEYQCDAAGKDRGKSGWMSGAPCHPKGKAPIQGFEVRANGTWATFYNAIVYCKSGNDEDEVNGRWCGHVAGQGQKFVTRLKVKLKRKAIYD